MTYHDKEVLLENFLLCRRIMNVPPVISKREQDKEYSSHQSAVKGMSRCKSISRHRDLSYNSYH